ncbi:GNAT family N-acetyltransferase [Lusitaniella coriacea]|nr:GNAT family N-acetyltransferase [Lusitaniella coriacea]
MTPSTSLHPSETRDERCMTQQPILQTQRLVLRPFNLADAPDVQRLAGAREIAANTAHIPHPYEDGVAEVWIEQNAVSFQEGKSLAFAIVERQSSRLCGAIGFGISIVNVHAELGYWIGKPYWGQGYCTEAARTILEYGFATLGLNRICSNHFARNPASGRVMEKIGMTYEGCLRQHFWKWGKFEDLKQYGILNREWQMQQENRF